MTFYCLINAPNFLNGNAFNYQPLLQLIHFLTLYKYHRVTGAKELLTPWGRILSAADFTLRPLILLGPFIFQSPFKGSRDRNRVFHFHGLFDTTTFGTGHIRCQKHTKFIEEQNEIQHDTMLSNRWTWTKSEERN